MRVPFFLVCPQCGRVVKEADPGVVLQCTCNTVVPQTMGRVVDLAARLGIMNACTLDVVLREIRMLSLEAQPAPAPRSASAPAPRPASAPAPTARTPGPPRSPEVESPSQATEAAAMREVDQSLVSAPEQSEEEGNPEGEAQEFDPPSLEGRPGDGSQPGESVAAGAEGSAGASPEPRAPRVRLPGGVAVGTSAPAR